MAVSAWSAEMATMLISLRSNGPQYQYQGSPGLLFNQQPLAVDPEPNRVWKAVRAGWDDFNQVPPQKHHKAKKKNRWR